MPTNPEPLLCVARLAPASAAPVLRARIDALIKNLCLLRCQFKVADDIQTLEPRIRDQVTEVVDIPDPLCRYRHCSPKCPWNRARADDYSRYDCIRAVFGGFSFAGICIGSVALVMNRDIAYVELIGHGLKLEECDRCLKYLEAMREWTLLSCWGENADTGAPEPVVEADSGPETEAGTMIDMEVGQDMPELPALLETFLPPSDAESSET